MRFDYCFAAPLCAPSRAMLMTGRYPFRTGVLDNSTGPVVTPQKEVSIAKVLKQAGYATAVAGKWRQLSHFTTRDERRRTGHWWTRELRGLYFSPAALTARDEAREPAFK